MSAFAISSPHHLATRAGERVLRDGGNAIDAALVASVVLTVVYPHNCQLGGDLIALLDRPNQVPVCVNSSGAAALTTDVDVLRSGGEHMPTSGPKTVTVPGVIAGWAKLHDAGATLSWSDLFTEAITLARGGVPVAEGLASAISEMPETHARDVGMAATFMPRGRALVEGDALVQERLGQTLEALSALGPEVFYGGDVGERLLGTLNQLGSRLSLDDLAAHEAETVAPLSREFRNLNVLTAPPNSQGFTFLGILGSLECLQESDTPISARILAALFTAAAQDRETVLADPDFADVPVDDLLSKTNVERRAEEALMPVREQGSAGQGPRPNGDTVAVVVADGAGNSISLIQSVFGAFGSGVLCPETGILLHNRGASFSLDAGSPNVIEPGKRPAHTLMPVMAFRDGELRYVNGTMGGLGQAQIHTQLLLDLLGGASPERVVANPRWVLGEIEIGGDVSSILAESRVPPSVTGDLSEAGFRVVDLDEFDDEVGHAQIIQVNSDGSMAAASDPRCDGLAVVAKRRNESDRDGRGWMDYE